MKKVTDLQILDRYMTGVLNRADHHAPKVIDAVPRLLGYVLTYGKDIELLGDGTGNVSWFRSRRSGKRHAFRYDHPTPGNGHSGRIELREHSIKGKLIYVFDNDTQPAEYDNTFRAL